jgi:hypothetical protein
VTFYVYTYILDGVPRYVGKGQGNRWRAHRKTDTHLGRFLRKHFQESKVWILPVIIECDSESSAIAEEIRLIALNGREDKGLGPLWNLTDGGDGASGYKHSDDFKTKMRRKTGDKNPFYGRTHSDEVKQRLSECHTGHSRGTGIKLSETHKAKISNGVRGDNNPACKIKKAQYPEIDALYAAGQTQKQIGEIVGLSQGQVSKILLRKVK